MKIEDTPLLKLLAPDTRRVESQREVTTARAEARGGSLVDRVDVSTQAAKVEETIAAAMNAPDLRNYLVDLARQLQNEGRLGADLDRLADRLIDSVLEL